MVRQSGGYCQQRRASRTGDLSYRKTFKNKEHVIAREVKSAAKELITTELANIVKESLEDILRTSFHNAQSSTQSVLYNVVEQDMLGLLPKDVISEAVDAHIVKFFDTYATAEGMSKRMVTSK